MDGVALVGRPISCPARPEHAAAAVAEPRHGGLSAAPCSTPPWARLGFEAGLGWGTSAPRAFSQRGEAPWWPTAMAGPLVAAGARVLHRWAAVREEKGSKGVLGGVGKAVGPRLAFGEAAAGPDHPRASVVAMLH
jgi:hypothetical protein